MVRPTAVAGTFYPAEASVLKQELEHYLQEATVFWEQHASLKNKIQQGTLRALILPHAGFCYSAQVAAIGYALWKQSPGFDQIQTIAIVCPNHTVPLENLALPKAQFFDSPLGRFKINTLLQSTVLEAFSALLDDRAHQNEHAIEVHLPFLAYLYKTQAKEILPVVLGRLPLLASQRFFHFLFQRPEVFVIVSTDLSHYEPYPIATEHDHKTLEKILLFQAEEVETQDACGAYPLRGFLKAAQAKGWVGHLLNYRNSGDTGGYKEKVVGYAAVAFVQP